MRAILVFSRPDNTSTWAEHSAMERGECRSAFPSDRRRRVGLRLSRTNRYGFEMVMLVPLLSPSGSWFAVATYVSVP